LNRKLTPRGIHKTDCTSPPRRRPRPADRGGSRPGMPPARGTRLAAAALKPRNKGTVTVTTSSGIGISAGYRHRDWPGHCGSDASPSLRLPGPPVTVPAVRAAAARISPSRRPLIRLHRVRHVWSGHNSGGRPCSHPT
jgi:hypothetical protein